MLPPNGARIVFAVVELKYNKAVYTTVTISLAYDNQPPKDNIWSSVTLPCTVFWLISFCAGRFVNPSVQLHECPTICLRDGAREPGPVGLHSVIAEFNCIHSLWMLRQKTCLWPLYSGNFIPNINLIAAQYKSTENDFPFLSLFHLLW